MNGCNIFYCSVKIEFIHQMGIKKSTMGCSSGKPVLTEYDKDYIANQTSATRDQVSARYEEFLKAHPSGCITKDEFSSMIRTCYPGIETESLERHIFRMYDTNLDGCIDFKEFMVVLYIMSAGTPEQNLEQIFRIFDIDGDGTITWKEMRKIVTDLFQLMSNEDNPARASNEAIASMAFDEMDADSDGNITKEEFIKACLNHQTISTMLAMKIIDVFVPDDERHK